MGNKKKKAARGKQAKKRKNAAKRREALALAALKPRWVGWMRERRYSDLKKRLSKKSLEIVRARTLIEGIVFLNAGTEPFVRIELSTPNSHIKALDKLVRRKTFRGDNFVNLATRQRCLTNCALSRENLFLVGYLSKDEYAGFERISAGGSSLSWTAAVIVYNFPREKAKIVEIYADVNWSMRRDLIFKDVEAYNFQEL